MEISPKQEIRVCHVVSSDLMLKFLLMHQIMHLRDAGFTPWAVSSPGRWIPDIEKEGIPVKTIEITRKMIDPISDIIALFRLVFFFRKEKFHIIHTYSPKAGFLGRIAAYLAGVPIIIYSSLGFYFNENTPQPKRNLFIFLEKIAGSASTLIFSINKEDIETAVREEIAPREKLRYLGGWVNLTRFNLVRFSPEDVQKKKEELGISHGIKIIGIVARLVKEKGYFELFDAFVAVVKKYPGSLLLVVGQEEPDKRDGFRIGDMIRAHGLENNVLYLGERTDVPEILSCMDIFVLPSYREGTPISVLEASSMKLPVVATNIRGCREAIDDGKTGILVPPKNPEKLAEAIRWMLANPEKAREMGEEGRKKMEREFDEKLVFARLEKEYRRLIQEKLKKRSQRHAEVS